MYNGNMSIVQIIFMIGQEDLIDKRKVNEFVKLFQGINQPRVEKQFGRQSITY